MIGLFLLVILLFMYWHYLPEIEYLRRSDMYIMWYNAGKGVRKYKILWRNN